MAKRTKKQDAASNDAAGCLVVFVIGIPAIIGRWAGVAWPDIPLIYAAIIFIGLLIFLGNIRRKHLDATALKSQSVADREVSLISPKSEAAFGRRGTNLQTAPEQNGTGTHAVSGQLRIHYYDRVGDETHRLITLHQAHGVSSRAGVFLPDRIVAYCHTRRAERTFIVTHIIEAIDNETGEVIANVAGWIRAHMRTPL